MKMNKKGFTLIELMVVILIVGILAAVAVPMMTGRINAAKWSEAAATAGTIRVAVRVYTAEKGATIAATDLNGKTVSAVLTELGFTTNDLEGTNFTASDYAIGTVAATGICDITVTGSKSAVTGSNWTMSATGAWAKN